MKRDFYESPKSSRIMRLFWKAAGADRYILERSTYSDQVKYVCLGGIIVATGRLTKEQAQDWIEKKVCPLPRKP